MFCNIFWCIWHAVTMTQYSCIEDRGVWLEVVLVSISASSYVAFIDKALVAKANRYLRPSSLFSLGTMDRRADQLPCCYEMAIC
ncbi:unnamed protein product, partial [Vitis vinifera]